MKKTVLGTLLCVLLALPATAETYTGQYFSVLRNAELHFRMEPNMNSPISDIIKTEQNDDLGIYIERGFILLENNPAGWHKVALQKKERYINKRRYYASKDVDIIVRYIDETQFKKNTRIEYEIKSEGIIQLYDQPNKNKPIATPWKWGLGIQEIGDKNWVITDYLPINYTNKKYYVLRQNLEENAILHFTTWGENNYKMKGVSDIFYVVDEITMTWAIFILSIALFISRMLKRGGNDNKPRKGIAYVISNTMFLSVCTLELIYVFTLQDASEITWFCEPNDVGWLWTIINFFLFGSVVLNQIFCVFDVHSDMAANKDKNRGLMLKGIILRISVYLLGVVATLLISFLFIIKLLVAAIFIIVGGGILWLIYGRSSNGVGSKATITYTDGWSEEAVQTGVGITGERIYEGKDSGNTIID